ncbi:hypothetical protein DEU56DRAFT_744691 [Suillus clintonianus]|uniref:uncharacterized protein n=1 Tax=Suillus clintonianus TaxID=1904413 RepID=UPI001B876EDE|nr:uncharacterized protein DEU56DRAFT_744691 [Suillus clintonianus]KAG2124368.1 hypothetical protein DEU56DRAFT_744691 [Suillus clintonianus]
MSSTAGTRRDFSCELRDSRKHSASPEHGSSRKRHRQDFRSGAGGSALSACAVCLGRNPHKIIECKSLKMWDGVLDTLCTHINKALTMRDRRPICNDWQRAGGCSETTNDRHQFCSGCSTSTHGAQTCPRA